MQTAEQTSALNLKADFTNLLSDISEKSIELSTLYKDIANLKADQALIDESNATIKKNLIAEADKLKEDQANLTAQKVVASEEQKKSDEQLISTKKDIKEVLKELARTNAYVLAAQEEHTKLIIGIANANEELKHLLVLVNKVEQTKLDLADLQEKKGVILGEISTSKSELDDKIKSTANKLALMETKMVESETKSKEAQNSWESYNRELHTNMNDYKVIRTRLEDKWNTTFPELEIPLKV